MWYCNGVIGSETAWWMILGGIWMVVFWGLIIGLAVWAIRRLTGHSQCNYVPVDKGNPLDIAKERYARGEISREEFEQIKQDLSRTLQ